MDSAIPVLAIRPATEHAVPELARLFTALGHPATAEAIAERWREWSAAGNTALVAPRRDGALAGAATLHRMVVLHRPSPVGRITALVVDTPLRGQGVGRALVAAAEETLARAGCGLLEITSHARLGYKQTSMRFAKVLVPAG